MQLSYSPEMFGGGECGAERAPRKVIKNAIIAFQQNNSLYACSPDPLSRSDKRVRLIMYMCVQCGAMLYTRV